MIRSTLDISSLLDVYEGMDDTVYVNRGVASPLADIRSNSVRSMVVLTRRTQALKATW
jgi:hypothetical protein